MYDDKIDIVIPWVDDSDEKWILKKNKFIDNKINKKLANDNRFFDYGTLKFTLRSIDKFMPWVNDVFILTDGQQPEWLSIENVKVIDHKDFIQGKLPTFNSNVIMTNIAHIKNLSNNFIIFNDEVIVWSQLRKSDFFLDGLPVDSLIETGTVPKSDGFFHISQNDVAIVNDLFKKRKTIKQNWHNFFNFHYGFQGLRSILALPYSGFIGFQNQHLALPYTKEDFKNAYKLCPEAFSRTWNHRFREFDDINEWLVRYIRNLQGYFHPGYLKGNFFTLSSFKDGLPKIKSSSKIIVINDDGYYNKKNFLKIYEFLDQYFPEKSKYEK